MGRIRPSPRCVIDITGLNPLSLGESGGSFGKLRKIEVSLT